MATTTPPGSLADLIEREFGFAVHPELNRLTDSCETTATKLTSNNPRRVGLTVINLGTTALYLTPDNAPSASRGIYIGPNGGSMTLDWRVDMTLISYDWWGIAITSADPVFVQEVVIT